MSQNIEQLEKINKELMKKNIEVSSILDAINFSSPVFSIDIERKISSVNKNFLFLTGLDESEIVGQNHSEIFSLPDDEEYSIFWEMLLSGETIQKEEVFKSKKIDLYLSIIYRPISDINDNIYYVYCIATDLTESKRLENEIKNKNLSISQSINYAKNIQSSMLINKEQLRDEFQTELIYYPKDIVSGDFYWAARTNNNKKVIAAVDCTGHGVPGAFLSFIGSKSLDETVLGNQISSPKRILECLDSNVKKVLHQENSKNRDGMDVSICSFEETEDGNIRLLFSGAKLPLYYYKKSENSVKQIKGSRKAIGGYYYEHLEFEEHELILEKGDILYLASDGFVDQNSKLHKRFGKLRFENMITQIVEYPIKKQREIMEQIFTKFTQNEEQRDDVTVLIVQL